MKSAHDPRHRKRQRAVKELFANTYSKHEAGELALSVLGKVEVLDRVISESAPQWPIDKLNRIDLAILRLATYELTETETPPKVIIDEAVELAKEFGGENSPSFVNGVLGNILVKVGKEESHEKENNKESGD
jgi:transcription antitermination factor NusB